MSTPTRASLRFTVLGAVTAVADGVELDVGSPQQRTVLAMLLLADGRPLDVDTVVDRIWGAAPPRSAAGVLRTYVYRLRRVLAPHADAVGLVIGTEGGAYHLDRGAAELDVAVADRERRAARAPASVDDPAGAAARLTVAAEQWSGAPLLGLAGSWADAERFRLEELRSEVALALADAQVRLGRQEDALPELRRLAEVRPLDERVATILLEALLALGRRAEALATYDRFRHGLADALGVSPGTVLQQVHQRMLRDDGTVPPVGREARPATGTAPPVRLLQPAGAAAPAQLPPDLPEFVGRADEVARVERAAAPEGAGGVVAVTGLGGMGKTTLAVHAAHRVRGAFPDGQFFVDLGAAGQPLPASEALLSLLLGAGVRRSAVPDGTAERSAAWRSVVADRRVLLVLDDAASAAQVRPLIPSGPGSLTLVTAARRFVDLPGARWSTLLPLAADESVELMGRLVGHGRLAREPGPTARLAAACSHQPLAVRVAAARLSDRPSWSVAEIEQQLYDDLDQPVVMHADCRIVDAPFRRASAGLSDVQRDAFHRLAHLPDGPFGVEAAARVLCLDATAARAVLEDLLDAHLLVAEQRGRYAFFALVRAYARRQPVVERARHQVA